MAHASFEDDGEYDDGVDDVKTIAAKTSDLLGAVPEESATSPNASSGSRKGRGAGGKKKAAAQKAEAPPSKGRAKKGKEKGWIKCRSCKRDFNSDELSTASDFCLICKRALDRLSKIAAREGDEACSYLSRCRCDPVEVGKLVKNYLEKTGVPAAGKRVKNNTYSILRYKEVVESVSGVAKKGRSRMMWRKQWILFAASVDGGCKSEESALAQWSEWCQRLSFVSTYSASGP